MNTYLSFAFCNSFAILSGCSLHFHFQLGGSCVDALRNIIVFAPSKAAIVIAGSKDSFEPKYTNVTGCRLSNKTDIAHYLPQFTAQYQFGFIRNHLDLPPIC
jgi:hypothetical protein